MPPAGPHWHSTCMAPHHPSQPSTAGTIATCPTGSLVSQAGVTGGGNLSHRAWLPSPRPRPKNTLEVNVVCGTSDALNVLPTSSMRAEPAYGRFSQQMSRVSP
eukprot:1188757-Prorocentrum_minimum.AAC.4